VDARRLSGRDPTQQSIWRTDQVGSSNFNAGGKHPGDLPRLVVQIHLRRKKLTRYRLYVSSRAIIEALSILCSLAWTTIEEHLKQHRLGNRMTSHWQPFLPTTRVEARIVVIPSRLVPRHRLAAYTNHPGSPRF
jgi:hypothetical protein